MARQPLQRGLFHSVSRPVIDAKNGDDDAQQGTNSTAHEDETRTTSLRCPDLPHLPNGLGEARHMTQLFDLLWRMMFASYSWKICKMTRSESPKGYSHGSVSLSETETLGPLGYLPLSIAIAERSAKC